MNKELLTLFDSNVIYDQIINLKKENNDKNKMIKQFELMEQYIGRNAPPDMKRDEIIQAKLKIQKTIMDEHQDFFKLIVYETLYSLSRSHDQTKNINTEFLLETIIGVIYGTIETLKWEEKYFLIYDHILNYSISFLYKEIELRGYDK